MLIDDGFNTQAEGAAQEEEEEEGSAGGEQTEASESLAGSGAEVESEEGEGRCSSGACAWRDRATNAGAQLLKRCCSACVAAEEGDEQEGKESPAASPAAGSAGGASGSDDAGMGEADDSGQPCSSEQGPEPGGSQPSLSGGQAVAPAAEPKHQKNASKRMFLDMEAELRCASRPWATCSRWRARPPCTPGRGGTYLPLCRIKNTGAPPRLPQRRGGRRESEWG